MPALFSAALFVLGTALGSFLNVVTLRYEPERSLFSAAALGGRSRCPHCGTMLRWWELIPLASYLVQRGRCRSCGARLTLQYPLVEALSGLILVGVPYFLNSFYGVSDSLFASFGAAGWYYLLVLVWVFAFLAWLAVFIIDLRHYLIPNELNVLLGALGIAAALLITLHHGALPAYHDSFLKHYALLATPFTFEIWMDRLVGAVAGGLFFGLLVALGRGRSMGMGDVKLAFASGLLLGWPDVLLATMIAFILGGLWGAILVARKEKTFGDKIPFGPFFVVGAAATVFFGYPFLKFYFSLFGF